jgi:hypothetical protein
MGEVRTEFELVNSVDDELCLRGTLAANAVRRCTVAMLVDTGAVEVFLPEDLVLQLGLRVRNNATETFQLAGPLTVRFGNRDCNVDCLVGPPGCEPLLGQIPMEAMDLVVNPRARTVTVNPASPYLPMLKMK